jgi:hypothetical protein
VALASYTSHDRRQDSIGSDPARKGSV